MAGHAGTAYWFSKPTGAFVTSNYYADRYPDWVTAFNTASPLENYVDQSWVLSAPPNTYRFSELDDQPWETDVAGFGNVFPHPYNNPDNRYFTTLITLSPAGDELVLEFAKHAILGEQLGDDEITDYLSISFSSTDYIGHVFGPSSLEAEDNLLRLDRSLADLLAFVDDQIGLEHTLVILSADHGGAEAPGALKKLNIPSSYFDPVTVSENTKINALQHRFGLTDAIIQSYIPPYIYLSEESLALHPPKRSVFMAEVVGILRALPGVAAIVSSDSLSIDKVMFDNIGRAVANNYHPERSGDLYVVLEPHHFINDFDGLTVTSTHGSPWSYDTHVPLIFAGWGIRPIKVHTKVSTVSLAPTIAQLLQIKSPSGALEAPLTEMLQGSP